MKTEQVTVPLPLNISDKDMQLFQPYCNYELRPQQIKQLKNVFVTNSGFCVNKKGLIRESHHDYSHQYQKYLDEVAWFYQDVHNHPENLIELNDKNYLLIHHPWYNYYHWVCEPLFRLWMVRERLDELTLILPGYYEAADFITGSLEPFKIKHIYYIPDRKSLYVKHLCMPQIKPICDSYNAEHLRGMREFYTNYVLKEKKIKMSISRRLYVSREFAGRRRIINEDDLLPVLKKFGFEIFHPERFSFLEQVAVFSQVEFLVGIHGSGLTNMLFMPEGAALLELHKDKTNELNHPSPLFWYMAEPLGIKYYHQVCETHGKEDYYTGDYMVDIDLFELNLNIMFD